MNSTLKKPAVLTRYTLLGLKPMIWLPALNCMTSFPKDLWGTEFKGLMLVKLTGCIAEKAPFPGLTDGEILSCPLLPIAADVANGTKINA